MITFYGSHICSSCRETVAYLEAHQIPYEMTEITENTANLKAFLQLRDRHPMFQEVKEAGRIGIPCFIRPDGIPSGSLEEVLRLEGLPYEPEEEQA